MLYGSWDYHFRTELFVQLPNNRCKSLETSLENSPYLSSSCCERKLRFFTRPRFDKYTAICDALSPQMFKFCSVKLTSLIKQKRDVIWFSSWLTPMKTDHENWWHVKNGPSSGEILRVIVAAPSGGKTRFPVNIWKTISRNGWLVAWGPVVWIPGSPKTKGIGIFRDTIEYPDSNPKPPTQKSPIYF